VSLLTLICALDSHLTALPGTTPRLLLLDDAFIAIDENGRRILMSILVDRDIDVVMTGFDLWLHYPEISSLDEFDIVATGDESPTTSVRHHWDGHKRHLRAV
jgi:recombinational DNA repair ATPase RecF